MLQPRILGREIQAIDCRLIVGAPPAPISSAISVFNLDDAIVSLAQPLTEALI
jgi:hypothetical protein